MLSVVATIFNKDHESLSTLLEGFLQQTCNDFELILVDDCSDIDYTTVLELYSQRLRLNYIRFGSNRGQCEARNMGLRESVGDVVAVIDSDCIPNRGWVRVHIDTHKIQPDTDILIGPYNIESDGRPIWDVVSHYEKDTVGLARDMQLQHPSDRAYFLNFITRNVSVKRSALPPVLFDPGFGYQASVPHSGYGWEDVEAGYRLWHAGLRFGFTLGAFTIHLSHQSTTDPVLKPMRSLRNFGRLLRKHPLILHTDALRWIIDTYGKIYQWYANTRPDQRFADDTLPWGTVIITLTPENDGAHPYVIDSVLRQWQPGLEIYLHQVEGFESDIAQYHAGLHSYVKSVQGGVPESIRRGAGRMLTVWLDDDLLLPDDQIYKPKSAVTPSPTIHRPMLGGFQDDGAAFTKDLVPILHGRPRRITKTLRVLTYRWHVGHQYELWKLPHEFHVAQDDTTMAWDYSVRPLPKHARLVDYDNIDHRGYDLAILHFDEGCINPGVSGGTLCDEWGAIFRRFLAEVTDIPRVAICHGTPPFHGMFDVDYSKSDLCQEWLSEKRRIVDALGDIPVICNSYHAWEQWGFRNSRVIWQGFDPAEYPIGTREGGLLYCANSIRHRPWYRGYFDFKHLHSKFGIDYLGRDDLDEFRTVRVPEPPASMPQTMRAAAKFRNYQNLLGKYIAFVNTTLRSPMPRTRAEAMLKGVCCVTMDFHDESMFIVNGVNGFTGKSKGELEEHLRWVLDNPDGARRIGMRGRDTMQRVFHNRRYLDEWHQTIYDVVG